MSFYLTLLVAIYDLNTTSARPSIETKATFMKETYHIKKESNMI